MRYRLVAVSLALLLSAIVLAANDSQVWPPLSEFDAVSGRAATDADVRDGRAVFLLQAQNGVSTGKPLRIEIPQYAFHVDEETRESTAVVIIQAEELADQRIVGAIVVGSGQALVGLLQEFRLLGTVAPD